MLDQEEPDMAQLDRVSAFSEDSVATYLITELACARDHNHKIFNCALIILNITMCFDTTPN